MGLISLTDYKVLTGEARTGNDTRIQELIDQASNMFETQTGRKIEQATYNESVDGNGLTRMIINQFPIISVASLSIKESSTLTHVLVIVDDLVIYKPQGWVEINIDSTLVSVFSKGQQNITIQYDAGYVIAPDDIKMAISQLTATGFRRIDRQQGVHTSKAFQGGSVVFRPNDFNDLWKMTVKNYKRRGAVTM